MKLRSESRTAAPHATPIAFTIPATQAITISNASSPLLRLPQELKDRIYQFVYGGLYFHEYERGNRQNIYIFSDITSSQLPIASLRACRQIYHDAKQVVYSANTFEFFNPKIILLFIRCLDVSYRNLALRSVVLNIYVDNYREREWDNVFRELADNFKNLRHLHIEIDEVIWSKPWTRRHSPAYRNSPFLRGLLELKQLPLKTVELVMVDRGIYGDPISQYIWTIAQKQEWAQRMKSAILGSE